MKNWIRIILICSILIGGTAFFVYRSLNQFNSSLDDLSASSLTVANISPIIFSNKTNKEQTSTTAPKIIPALETSNDLKKSFMFPNINKDVYIGCTYQLSFKLETTISSLETVLVDAGSKDTIEPSASGLAKEYKIEPNSQSLDWKVAKIFSGKYYIKVSNTNGFVLRSDVFTIKNMPEGISTEEREKNCKASDS